jgi:hypothetical protein
MYFFPVEKPLHFGGPKIGTPDLEGQSNFGLWRPKIWVNWRPFHVFAILV